MISAIILAAGQSKRMGQPKMLLRWGDRTVLEHVLTTFLHAGIEDLLVVIGGNGGQIQPVIERYPVQIIYNSNFAVGEMLSSLQCGLRALPNRVQATLVGLGDQPQVQERTVRWVCQAYQDSKPQLVVPSFQMRRGHPWLVARPLWDEILALKPSESPRDFLNRHANEIYYVEATTPSILADLDTPDDYRKNRPQG